MPTSTFGQIVTASTVETAVGGGLSGDGSSGNKLAVDGLSGTSTTQVLFNKSGVVAGNAALTFNDATVALSLVGDGTNSPDALSVTKYGATSSGEVGFFEGDYDSATSNVTFSGLFANAGIVAGRTIDRLVSVFAGGNYGAGTATESVGLFVDDVDNGTTNYAIKTGAGIVHFGGVVNVPEVAFASLPASPVVGMLIGVNNSNTATWGATIAGGGANHVLAYYNGSNWTVAAK